jgi:hypothetical protein
MMQEGEAAATQRWALPASGPRRVVRPHPCGRLPPQTVRLYAGDWAARVMSCHAQHPLLPTCSGFPML